MAVWCPRLLPLRPSRSKHLALTDTSNEHHSLAPQPATVCSPCRSTAPADASPAVAAVSFSAPAAQSHVAQPGNPQGTPSPKKKANFARRKPLPKHPPTLIYQIDYLPLLLCLSRGQGIRVGGCFVRYLAHARPKFAFFPTLLCPTSAHMSMGMRATARPYPQNPHR